MDDDTFRLAAIGIGMTVVPMLPRFIDWLHYTFVAPHERPTADTPKPDQERPKRG